MTNEEREEEIKMMKTISTVVAVGLFVLGLAMGYLGAKQEAINTCYDNVSSTLCESGYYIECVPEKESSSTFKIFQNNDSYDKLS